MSPCVTWAKRARAAVSPSTDRYRNLLDRAATQQLLCCVAVESPLARPAFQPPPGAAPRRSERLLPALQGLRQLASQYRPIASVLRVMMSGRAAVAKPGDQAIRQRGCGRPFARPALAVRPSFPAGRIRPSRPAR